LTGEEMEMEMDLARVSARSCGRGLVQLSRAIGSVTAVLFLAQTGFEEDEIVL
jgi:hypothetical protein